MLERILKTDHLGSYISSLLFLINNKGKQWGHNDGPVDKDFIKDKIQDLIAVLRFEQKKLIPKSEELQRLQKDIDLLSLIDKDHIVIADFLNNETREVVSAWEKSSGALDSNSLSMENFVENSWSNFKAILVAVTSFFNHLNSKKIHDQALVEYFEGEIKEVKRKIKYAEISTKLNSSQQSIKKEMKDLFCEINKMFKERVEIVAKQEHSTKSSEHVLFMESLTLLHKKIAERLSQVQVLEKSMNHLKNKANILNNYHESLEKLENQKKIALRAFSND